MSEVVVSNAKYWTGQSLPEVMHGLSIDTKVIERVLPRIERDDSGQYWPWFYELYELGAGNCELAFKLANLEYFQVRAIDINPAVSNVSQVLDDGLARLTTLSGHVGNVTHWGEGIGKDSVLNIERIDGVIVQSLLPSLLGDNGNEWKNMFDVVALCLAPDKFLFLNDFRPGDYYYSALAKIVGAKEWRRQMMIWKERYYNNQLAFASLNIPSRTFIVGKPGTEGKEMELGSVKTLKELYRRKDLYERFARHVGPNEINLHLRRLGFSLVYEQYDGYKSRGHKDIFTPTDLQVWQKNRVFQYHYLAKDLDIRDPNWEYVALDRMRKMRAKCEEQNIKYFWKALDILAKNEPHSQIESILRLRDQF